MAITVAEPERTRTAPKTGKIVHEALKGVNPRSVIDKSSPVPLHHQLEMFLRQGIESGLFTTYETLPTEQELQEHFKLSRTPIRQALAKLSADGLIDRRRSQGTLVLPQPFEEHLHAFTPFTEEVRRKGQTPGSKLLEFTIIPADADAERLLALPPGASIFHFRRLRFINNEPVGILTTHVAVSIVPDLQASDFTDTGPQQSLYYVLERIYGLRMVRATETFRAVTLDAEGARLLRVHRNTAVLMRSRVTFDLLGRPVTLEQALYRGVYRIEWSGREVSYIEGDAGL